MDTHILNGDSVAYEFVKTNIPGNVAVCRECLIDGPVQASSLAEFWHTRSSYITKTYQNGTEGYDAKVVSEFNKLLQTPGDSAINLWFEDDLFCQANMWFILSFLQQNGIERDLFRVFPKQSTDWNGFGPLRAPELIECHEHKVQFHKEDIDLGVNLWAAYQHADLERMKELSGITSACFHHLKEVVQAHVDRFPPNGGLGRPSKTLKEIVDKGETDFYKIFAEFFRKEGIYGFGDLQVKVLLEKIYH
jgi:hypothetical protein